MQQIKTLIVAGCSHSFGAETVSEKEQSHPDSINFSYGKFLSNLLQCEKYINISSCGISNFEISNRVTHLFLNKKHDLETTLVVIGWTDSNRFTFYHKKLFGQDTLPRINSLLRSIPDVIKGTNVFCQPYNFSYNFSSYQVNHLLFTEHREYLNYITNKPGGTEFLNFFNKYIFDTPYYYDLNYNARLHTTEFLKNRNIKHITFPCVSIKKYSNTFLYEKELAPQNNIVEYRDRFNLLQNFNSYGSHKGGHLKKEAHEAFASFLYNELGNRKVL